MTEDEMVGWHETEQTLEDDEEQEGLTCCSPRGHE